MNLYVDISLLTFHFSHIRLLTNPFQRVTSGVGSFVPSFRFHVLFHGQAPDATVLEHPSELLLSSPAAPASAPVFVRSAAAVAAPVASGLAVVAADPVVAAVLETRLDS